MHFKCSLPPLSHPPPPPDHDLTKAEGSSDRQLPPAPGPRATSHFQVKYGVMDYTSGKLMRLSSLWMDDITQTTNGLLRHISSRRCHISTAAPAICFSWRPDIYLHLIPTAENKVVTFAHERSESIICRRFTDPVSDKDRREINPSTHLLSRSGCSVSAVTNARKDFTLANRYKALSTDHLGDSKTARLTQKM